MHPISTTIRPYTVYGIPNISRKNIRNKLKLFPCQSFIFDGQILTFKNLKNIQAVKTFLFVFIEFLFFCMIYHQDAHFRNGIAGIYPGLLLSQDF